jgi:maleate isomerase
MVRSFGGGFLSAPIAGTTGATAIHDDPHSAHEDRAVPGWRARIGVVVPSVNVVVEPWFAAVSPPGVSIHASRMFLDNALSRDAIERMDKEDGMRAVHQLTSLRPKAVAYCCTASSIVQGLEYDRHLQHEVGQSAGVPATTATQGILAAARVLGVTRIAAVSPYAEEIDEAEHRFFEAAGLHIASSACLGIRDSFGLAAPGPQDIYELAMRGWSRGAEALLITCLNFWSHLVIERLEKELHVPVITSTQATLWRVLRIAGIEDRIAGYGTLLSSH